MKKEALVIQNWDDLVFENRNKEYGAYVIRKSYLKNVTDGLIGSALVALLVLTLPKVIYFFGTEKIRPLIPGDLPPELLLMPPPIIQPQAARRPATPPAKPIETNRTPTVTTQPVQEEIEGLSQDNQPMIGKGDAVGETDPLQGKLSNGTENTPAISPEPVIRDIAEVMPQYNGGLKALMRFIKKELKYPSSAKRMGIEGTIYVQFVVNQNGRVVDVEVIKGISADCDKESARVVGLMPPWNPGMQNKRPVSVRMILPIKFKFDE